MPSNSNNKRYFLIAVFFATLIISSCKKNLSDDLISTQGNLTLTEVKKMYNSLSSSKYVVQGVGTSNKPNELLLWERNKQILYKNKNIISVEVSNARPNASSDEMLFIKAHDTIFAARLSIYPDKSYLVNHKEINKNDFSGLITLDPITDRSYRRAMKVVNGKCVGLYLSGSALKRSNSVADGKQTNILAQPIHVGDVVTTTDGIQCTVADITEEGGEIYYHLNNCAVLVYGDPGSSYYSGPNYHWIFPNGFPYPTGVGDPPQGGYPDNPYYPISGNNEKAALRESFKVDSLRVKYPCAVKLVLDKLLNLQPYTEFIQPFRTDVRPDLDWDSQTLAWNTPNGNGSNTYQLGQEIAATGSRTGQSRSIVLNDKMLQNSSQLLIAAASIHETIHAYIGFNIATAEFNVQSQYNDYGSWFASLDAFYTIRDLPRNYSDHYQMLEDYFGKAVSILSSWDNNAHTPKEYAMAMLYGLNTVDPNCPADVKNRLDTVYNKIKTNNNITDQDLTTFYTNNLNAQSSEKLPSSGCN
jgi:hypothetical protein